jgi:hypothetical protein
VNDSPVTAAECRVWINALNAPSLIQSVGSTGDDEWDRLLSRHRRVRPQRQRNVGELLAYASPAAWLGVHRLAFVRVEGAGAPVRIEHQVRDGGRRQDRVVPTRVERDLLLAPHQTLRHVPLERREVDR